MKNKFFYIVLLLFGTSVIVSSDIEMGRWSNRTVDYELKTLLETLDGKFDYSDKKN